MSNSLLLTILEFILALGVLIFLHELGHYAASKIFKIQVEEFGFGLPPRLFKIFQLGETEFTINALPFGAFVRPKGENDPQIPGGMAAANPFVRLIVLLGGPVMNIITGILLFSIVFMRSGVPDTSLVQIMTVTPGTPAQQSGLLPDDLITHINQQPITDMQMLIETVRENAGNEITLTILRADQTLQIATTPRLNPPAGEGALGISLGNPLRPASWQQTIPLAAQAAYDQTYNMLSLPGQLIRGTVKPEEARMVGPKGMFDIYQSAREKDTENANNSDPLASSNTLWLMAIISVALGITNLLPLPALDGGRILFLIPEVILRRRVPAQYENFIHLVGFVLLIILMVYITAQDFINPIVLP